MLETVDTSCLTDLKSSQSVEFKAPGPNVADVFQPFIRHLTQSTNLEIPQCSCHSSERLDAAPEKEISRAFAQQKCEDFHFFFWFPDDLTLILHDYLA